MVFKIHPGVYDSLFVIQKMNTVKLYIFASNLNVKILNILSNSLALLCTFHSHKNVVIPHQQKLKGDIGILSSTRPSPLPLISTTH